MTGTLAEQSVWPVDRIKDHVSKIGVERLMAWEKQLDELRVNLRINVNRQLATEAILLSLSGH